MSTSKPNNESQPRSSLPEMHSHITTHDETTSKAVYHSSTPLDWHSWDPGGNDIIYSVPYTTSPHPAILADEADIKAHEQLMASGGYKSVKALNGSSLRLLDLPPGYKGVMHRTVSLDYGIVLEGKVEILLDGEGETRVLERGDITVQRGTMHALHNPSSSQWARFVSVVLDIKKVVVGGKELEEQWGL